MSQEKVVPSGTRSCLLDILVEGSEKARASVSDTMEGVLSAFSLDCGVGSRL